MGYQIENEVKEIIHKVTGIEKDKILDNTSIRNELYIDSLQAVQITSLIEEKFNVEIDEVEIFNVDIVKDIYQLILEEKKI